MGNLWREFRHVVRSLTAAPGFTAPAVLTLALGIGANVALFSVLDAVVFWPLPFPKPESLVSIQYAAESSWSASRMDRFVAEARSFQGVAGYTGWGFAFTDGTTAARLDGARVSPNLFALLGVAPARGRLFSDDEARRGSGAVALLSDALWRTRFGADPAILDHLIMLDGRSTRVVGVMPPGFVFPNRSTRLWTPAPLNPADASTYGAGMLTVIGRLTATGTARQATEELRAFRRRLRLENGTSEPFDPAETRVVSLVDHLAGPQRPAMVLLAAVVAAVFLIACANVANLILLRGVVRARALAVRVALGASRASLAREALLEALVLASAGGIAGLIVAGWTQGALVEALVPDAPMLREIEINVALIGMTLLISVVAAALVGLIPVLRAWRPDLETALRESGRGGVHPNRLRSLLVVSELGLALLLAIGAGLLLKNFERLTEVDPGFQAERILTASILPPDPPYDEKRAPLLWTDLFDRVNALPGVIAAGAIHLTPMGRNNWNPDLAVEGAPPPRPGESRSVDWRVVTPDYFRTMGIPVRRGRGFAGTDRGGVPLVAVVNEALVARYFGSADPLGKRVNTDFEGKDAWATVVGVVGNVRGHGLGAAPEPELYRPFAQHPLAEMALMVRGAADPAALGEGVRRAVGTIDSRVIVDQVQVMRDVVDASLAGSRHIMLLLLGFGFLALTVAALGVFSVMSFAVAQRERELSIRVALGASQTSIVSLVLAQGATWAGAGAVLGLLAASAGGGLLRSQLSLVASTDPATYAGASVTLMGVALVACYLPARRAAQADPARTLRTE
jgi:predicted permease